MKKKYIIITAVLAQLFFACANSSGKTEMLAQTATREKGSENADFPMVYKSKDLIVRKVSNQIYQHISFLENSETQKTPCNGMIVIHEDDAVILDTPVNDQTAMELVEFLRFEMNVSVSGIVATHFHKDGLGGLQVFHRYGINSYASNKTIELAAKNNYTIPQQGFDKEFTLNVGNKKVHLEHFGEGYTSGNIVGYFPDEQVLFGGGLIKEIGAEKGDLEDANLKEWPKTIQEIKAKYPALKTVIPGHGRSGGTQLLDYTANLFSEN